MPYITQDRRSALNDHMHALSIELDSADLTTRAGELNYVISSLLAKWPRRYWTLALAMGVLFTCALEFYRRCIAPYEDTKIKENGDVY